MEDKRKVLKVQSGFTLIELMIVVAIIGILAAVAIASYADYAARAQVTEALTVTDPLRVDLALYLHEEGDFAGLNANSTIDTAAAAIEGKYLTDGAVTVADDTGEIAVPFDAGVHSGETLLITPIVNGGQISSWTCSGLEAKYLPSACQ